MLRHRLWLLAGLVVVVAGSTGLRTQGARIVGAFSGVGGGVAPVWTEVESGWELSTVWTLPERVNALMTPPVEAPGELQAHLYVGMAGTGSIHRVVPGSFGAGFIVSRGLGDAMSFGESNVNRLALHDLDGDGALELIGSTSQILPRGRPRLHVWHSTVAAAPERAVARPEIASSWSHSLAFLARPGSAERSAFVTFCGHGEIVEYRLRSNASREDGFRHEELSWKQVGQLPVSGEWLEAGDVDNDQTPDLVVATGYALNGAGIHIYHSPTAGAPLEPIRVIDEDRRFGNVRFKLFPDAARGENRLVAWWCTDLAGGRAEMIEYRLGPEGVRERRVVRAGPASELWADDGHFDLGDVDGDGRMELWFATTQGAVWRYDPDRPDPSSPALRRIATFRESIGPMTFGRPIKARRKPCIYLGRGRSVIRIEASKPGEADRLRRRASSDA